MRDSTLKTHMETYWVECLLNPTLGNDVDVQATLNCSPSFIRSVTLKSLIFPYFIVKNEAVALTSKEEVNKTLEPKSHYTANLAMKTIHH